MTEKKKPFEFTDKIKDLTPLYFEAGAGLYDCQVLEFGLCQMLLSLSVQGLIDFDVTSAVKIAEDVDKKTIGQIMSILKRHLTFSHEWENDLSEAIAARNSFVHRFLVDNLIRMATQEGRDSVTKDIRKIRRKVQTGNAVVQKIMDVLFERFNLTEADVAALTEHLLENDKGRSA